MWLDITLGVYSQYKVVSDMVVCRSHPLICCDGCKIVFNISAAADSHPDLLRQTWNISAGPVCTGELK